MKRHVLKSTVLAAMIAVGGMGAASVASAYDGYCYQKKKDAGRDGAIVGAVVGGAVGSQVSKNERGLGTVAGAVIGGVIGNNVGKKSVKCYQSRYYSYEYGRYEPAPPPDGYVVSYYNERPRSGYNDVWYDRHQRRHKGY